MKRAVISTHFLRRRAEARAKKIRASQRAVRRTHDPGTRAVERDALRKLGVGVTDRIAIEKKGRWDARYIVVAY